MYSTTQVIVIGLPVLLVSISIHEMAHAFTSDRLGDDTARLQGRVSLNPLHHIDPFLTVLLPLLLILIGAPPFGAAKPVQVNFNRIKWGEYGAAIVGVVGPICNLILAALAALALKHFNIASEVLFNVLAYTVILNVGLGIFNLIPWPPLDGSRLLYAFAPRPIQGLMESIERMGMAGLVIFLLLFYQFGASALGSLAQKLTSGLLS